MSDWDLDPLNARLKKRGIIEQRGVLPHKRKKIDRPWVVCWFWRIRCLPDRIPSTRKFATRELAERYVDQMRRSFSCHPYTNKDWGPGRIWIEGPAETQRSDRSEPAK